MVVLPSDLTGHEIAGVLLGETNNGTQFVEKVDPNIVKTIEQTGLLTTENDVVHSKVPYILDWTNFALNSEGKQPSKLTLHFKPVGNLLRIQFNNLLPEAKTLQSFKIKSNAFVTQAKFDFSNGNNLQLDINNYTGENPTTQSGSPMAFLPENYQMEKTYQLDTPIRIEANRKSKWHYLWVMALAYNTRDVNNGLVYFLTQATGIGHDSKEYNLSAVCSPLSEGSNKLSMSLNIRPASTLATAFKGGKLPLWYVAEYDVAPNGSTFGNTHMLTGDQENQSSTCGFF